MRPTSTRATALALLPALSMLVLTGCSGGSTSGAGSSPSAGTTTVSSPPASGPSTTPTSPATQANVTINVTVANGKVSPSGASINVKASQTVLVTAVSDVAEELHIHGYDKLLELSPGKPASVKFSANMKGTFEVETHKSGKLVAKLVVS